MEEKNKIKQKQMVLMFIGIAILLVSITGITFAFFNYTKTGGANVIKTGNIEFNMTQGKTINLQNVFPVTSAEALADNSNTSVCEIVITGRNTYAGGVEYLVSTVNATNTDVPVSILVNVEGNGNGANDNLGISDNDYFTNRNSYTTSHYKKLVGDSFTGNQDILVGYIASSASTDNSINGKITIRAYFDKNNIIITDTPDETNTSNKTVMSTSEWNALNSNGVSFQVRVEANEGKWVENPNTLYNIIKRESLGVDTNLGVDFSKVSNDDGLNGEGTKGVYTFSSTKDDEYPVYYYRGAVTNNNILFNNLCWKAVRTTDTGGVKLIYNGHPENTYVDISKGINAYKDVVRTGPQFEFDNDTNEWRVTLSVPESEMNSGEASIKFKVVEAGNYLLKFFFPGNGPFVVKRGSTSLNYTFGANTVALNGLETDEEITVAYTHYGSQKSATVTVAIFEQMPSIGCNDNYDDSLITLNINGADTKYFDYSTNMNSGFGYNPASGGYMYGKTYSSTGINTVNVYYDNTFAWDGTNYNLSDSAGTIASNENHYSCGSNQGKQCDVIQYAYSDSLSLILTEGDGIEEAIEKMQTNTYNSNAKDIIDTWFASNMESTINKLEDTIFCNDRSIASLGGFDPNGGDLSKGLIYGSLTRANPSGTPTPSLDCPQKNDSFTVANENGNQKLIYPVGMLTVDEVMIAGGRAPISSSEGAAYSSFYLNSRRTYWSMSPAKMDTGFAIHYAIGPAGNILLNATEWGDVGLRPVISLKKETIIQGGNGNLNNPYIVS